jgi:hypothetical protein
MKLPPLKEEKERVRGPQREERSVHSPGSQVQRSGPQAQLCKAQSRCQAAGLGEGGAGGS